MSFQRGSTITAKMSAPHRRIGENFIEEYYEEKQSEEQEALKEMEEFEDFFNEDNFPLLQDDFYDQEFDDETCHFDMYPFRPDPIIAQAV